MSTSRKSNRDQRRRHAEVLRVWRENRCLKQSSITVYLRWVNRFEEYCHEHSLDVGSQLTLLGVYRFAKWYTRIRKINFKVTLRESQCALRAWALAMRTFDDSVPCWSSAPDPIQRPASTLMCECAEYLQTHRGNPPATAHKKITHIAAFLKSLPARRKQRLNIQLRDIDAFVIQCRKRYARTTVADMCGSIRAFLRFLHATERSPVDLSASVMAPIVRRGERPARALPWSDVQRILRAVDRSNAMGQRDYAMLLLMSTYGLGAGEVIRLTLDDIDWRHSTLCVTRPKTGVKILLPLLPAVARVLATYLRRGRPAYGATRYLFVAVKAPYLRMTASSAVRHIIIKHARIAGISADYLGSHVLRHSYANRLMEQGARTKVIGDILGHRRAESTSAYLRTPTERLRKIALAVPK